MKINRIVKIRIGTPGENGFEITNLKTEFRIEKFESSDPNTCNVSIYNLNKFSRSKIDIKKSIIFVYAGYEDDNGAELLFTGNVNSVNHIFNKPNIITKIEAVDGGMELTETRLSLSYKEGSSVYQVVKKALDKLGLPVKTLPNLEILKTKKFTNGNSFMGGIKNLFDIIFAGINMDWSIQNGEIKFYEKTETDNSFAVELNSETGLIYSPEKIKIKKATTDENPEIDGWIFKSLLESKIEPGGSVLVKSKTIPLKTQFKVVTVEHIGNSFEGDFMTTTKAMAL